MTTTRRIVGLLVGLMVSAYALSASAAYYHCPDPNKPDWCYPIELQEVRVPFDDPGPYQVVDIASIAADMRAIIGANPEPNPWLLLDMETAQMVVLDLENETAYVPEPGRLALLCGGAGGLALLGRRRRS